MAERYGSSGTTRCDAERSARGVRCNLHRGHDREGIASLRHGHLEEIRGRRVWLWWGDVTVAPDGGRGLGDVPVQEAG